MYRDEMGLNEKEGGRKKEELEQLEVIERDVTKGEVALNRCKYGYQRPHGPPHF